MCMFIPLCPSWFVVMRITAKILPLTWVSILKWKQLNVSNYLKKKRVDESILPQFLKITKEVDAYNKNSTTNIMSWRKIASNSFLLRNDWLIKGCFFNEKITSFVGAGKHPSLRPSVIASRCWWPWWPLKSIQSVQGWALAHLDDVASLDVQNQGDRCVDMFLQSFLKHLYFWMQWT